MYEVWEGDLMLFTVTTEYEADEMREQGYKVVRLP
jgi:hypothetical protein